MAMDLNAMEAFPRADTDRSPRDRAYDALVVAEKKSRDGVWSKGADQALNIARAWIALSEHDRKARVTIEEGG